MIFVGIAREFSLENRDQYRTIGNFWDEMAALYGLERLRGLGYKWADGKIFYAIGLKLGDLPGADFQIELPDGGWVTVDGKTEELERIYEEIYREGALTYEIETFDEDGDCRILYYR